MFTYICLFLDFSGDLDLNLTIREGNVRFFVIGDWGGMRWLPYKTVVKERVSHSMATHARVLRTHFQIGTGDNFYASGVRSNLDKRFEVRISKIYKLSCSKS
jgi:hypothetical protein